MGKFSKMHNINGFPRGRTNYSALMYLPNDNKSLYHSIFYYNKSNTCETQHVNYHVHRKSTSVRVCGGGCKRACACVPTCTYLILRDSIFVRMENLSHIVPFYRSDTWPYTSVLVTLPIT